VTDGFSAWWFLLDNGLEILRASDGPPGNL